MVEDEKIIKILKALAQVEEDLTVPKNIREKIKYAIGALQEQNKETSLKIDKSLQELDGVSEDPNISSYTRTQVWNIISLLESI